MIKVVLHPLVLTVIGVDIIICSAVCILSGIIPLLEIFLPLIAIQVCIAILIWIMDSYNKWYNKKFNINKNNE